MAFDPAIMTAQIIFDRAILAVGNTDFGRYPGVVSMGIQQAVHTVGFMNRAGRHLGGRDHLAALIHGPVHLVLQFRRAPASARHGGIRIGGGDVSAVGRTRALRLRLGFIQSRLQLLVAFV